MKNLHLDKKTQRVTIQDTRFYKHKDDFYPGVTTVLGAYPKGAFLNQWYKEVGTNADIIIQKAFKLGSAVHNAIEDFQNGIELRFMDEYGNKNFTYEAWKMIVKYTEFHKFIDSVDGIEMILTSEKYKLGGTLDLLCKIDGETWLLDHKTSKSIWKTNQLQLAIYRKMLEDLGIEIHRHGILWLNAHTRTEKGFMQGKGWQIKEFTDSYEKDLNLFHITHELWNEENQKFNPNNIEFDNVLKLY